MAACDVECQRNKKLKQLSSAMVDAIQNKEQDPEAYEKARVEYNTYKHGQEWAHVDSEQKAKEAVQPILDSYQQQFDQMKTTMAYNSALQQAKQDAMSGQAGDEDEIRFVHSQIEKARDESSVYERMNELQGTSSVYSWLPTFLDLCLAITILHLVYQVYVGKLTAFINYFTQSAG